MKPLHQHNHEQIGNLHFLQAFILIHILLICTLFPGTAYSQQGISKDVNLKLQKQFNDLKSPEISFEKYKELNRHIYERRAVQTKDNLRIDKSVELSALSAAFAPACSALHDVCENGDFESGNIDQSQWRGAFGTWGAGEPNPFSLTEGFSSGSINSSSAHQTIVTHGPDPVTGIPMVSPAGGNYALRLGNRVNGAGTEMISKTIEVTAGRTIIPFYYALVFEDPGHNAANQPAFSVKGYDCNGNELPTPICDLGNGSDIAVSDAQNPFFQSANGGNIAYKNWSIAQVNLSAYVGQTITIVFLNKDCGLTGHFGYTYLDNLCTVCSTGCPYNITINERSTNCGKGSICVDYTLPRSGSATGDVTIDLDIFQNGILVHTITSPTLNRDGSFCFKIDTDVLPVDQAPGGFDYTITGRFSINQFSLSPLVVGQPPNGQVEDINNDYFFSAINVVCKSITVTLVNGAAVISAADIDGGSSATCGISQMIVSKTDFGCTDLGSNLVTLQVIDRNGASAVCTTIVEVTGMVPACSIKAIPTNNIYTGGIPTTIYLGYGPQSVKLDPQASGGSSFTYEWTPVAGLDNPGIATPTFTPTTEGIYYFNVKVTNEFGCASYCNIAICVLDIRVPGTDGKKVYVCHTPPGNPANAQDLSISVNAVAAHIFNPGHGDRLGRCDQLLCSPRTLPVTSVRPATNVQEQLLQPLEAKIVSSTGAPAINLYISSGEKGVISVKLHDMFGRLVKTFNGISPNSILRINENLKSGIYYAQVIQGKKAVSLKLNIMR